MGRAALIIVLGASVLFSILSLQVNRTEKNANEQFNEFIEKSLARDAGNQAMEYLLTRLADSSTWRTNKWSMLPPEIIANDEARVYYQVQDAVVPVRGFNKPVIRLVAEVRYGRSTDSVVVYTEREFGFVPETIRGVITSIGPLTKAVGDMVIDGRNRDTKGAFDQTDPGAFAVSSGEDFVNERGAFLGGRTSDGFDVPPNFPEDPRTVEKLYNWAGTYPVTPDEAVGLPEGTLLYLAKTGVDGSQYVTSPAKLNYPLSGVTYVDLPSGAPWRGPNLTNSEGILVVHNSSLDARLENPNTLLKPFRGLIIADYAFHTHVDMLGAMVLLSPNLEEKKTCTGNQWHRLMFSRRAIREATSVISKVGTGWQGRVPVIAWKD